MLEVHDDGRSVVSTGTPRGDGARRPGDARVRPVGHDGRRRTHERAASSGAAGGGAVATFTGFEADLLRSLASQLVELLRNEAAAPRRERRPARGSCSTSPGPTTAPDDPVLARLFPTAYPDDEEAAGEFRRFTESDAARRQGGGAAPVIDTLEEAGLPAELGEDGLVIDVELDQAAGGDLDAVVHRHAARARPPGSASRRATRTTGSSLPDEDPRAHVHDIYDWLGYLQETLVEALAALTVSGCGPAPGYGVAAAAYPGDVLTIDRATYDAIVAHAKRDHPDEACGVVAGPEGSDRPERFVADGQRRRPPDVLRVRLHRAARALQGDGRPRRGAGGRSTTRTPPPRPTRAAPTSASPASRAPTTCWSAPASTGIVRARWSSGPTGSSTAR